MLEEKHKVCFKCGELKPLSAFYKHPRMADGYVNKCKECNKKDVRNNRKEKVEYYREYDNVRNLDKTSKRYLSKIENGAAYRKANQEKRKAQSAVASAILSCKIVKPVNCDYCGKECKLHGHHSAYSEDMHLAVTWLCPECHCNLHKQHDLLLESLSKH